MVGKEKEEEDDEEEEVEVGEEEEDDEVEVGEEGEEVVGEEEEEKEEVAEEEEEQEGLHSAVLTPTYKLPQNNNTTQPAQHVSSHSSCIGNRSNALW